MSNLNNTLINANISNPITNYASLLLSTASSKTNSNVAPTSGASGAPAGSQPGPSGGFAKKIIIDPYRLGQSRRFADFLVEFEDAVRRTNQRPSAWAIILRDHLGEREKAHYDLVYTAGMDYNMLRLQLTHALEILEQEYEQPYVSPSVQYVPTLGTYGFLLAITNDLRRYTDTPAIRMLAVDEFWKRIPSNVGRALMNTVQIILVKFGSNEVDLNCLLVAAMVFDKTSRNLNKYENLGGSGVPPPPAAGCFANDTLVFGLQNQQQGVNNNNNGKNLNYKDHANFRGRRNGFQRGGCAGYSGGQSRHQQPGAGGGHGTRTFSRGGYGGNRGSGQGSNRFPSNGPNLTPGRNYKCWQCNSYGQYYIQHCPKANFPYAPICPSCSQPHSPAQPCPAQTSSTSNNLSNNNSANANSQGPPT